MPCAIAVCTVLRQGAHTHALYGHHLFKKDFRLQKGKCSEEGRKRHYYRIGLCSRSFVPADFGPGTIGGFCPESNG